MLKLQDISCDNNNNIVHEGLLHTDLVLQFTAHAFDVNTRRETDEPLPITVIVEDVNDNAPQFSGPMVFAVNEQCPMGK